MSSLTLEQYFQRNILQPLGMKDTTFVFPADKFDRLVGSSRRQPDGSLKEDPRTMPVPPKAFNGGGGLFSTAPDYVLFMQTILKHGRGPNNAQILQPKTVAMMIHPGVTDGFTYGFPINKTAYPGGRSAGSLAWAGVENTFYWIDPRRSLCAVVMMEFFPFVDSQAVGLLGDFEKAVYAG